MIILTWISASGIAPGTKISIKKRGMKTEGKHIVTNQT